MAGRRLKVVRQCVECLQDFRPYHWPQVTCSRRCAAYRRHRRQPAPVQNMHAARAKQFQAYAKRLGERLKTMGKGDIWRMAYERGYQAGHRAAQRIVLRDHPMRRSA